MTKPAHPIRWLLALLLAAMTAPGLAMNEQDRRPEEVIRAYLWKIAGYVTWPRDSFDTPETPLVIGVVGDERLSLELTNRVRGQRLGKRTVKVDRIRGIEFRAPAQIEHMKDRLSRCHIVYISRNEREHVAAILDLLKESKALTFSDTEDFAKNGGMIEFIVSPKRTITFRIHQTKAEKAGLRLDPDLLDYAELIYRDKE